MGGPDGFIKSKGLGGIGTIVGGVAGGIFGAGNPAAIAAGASLGGAAGGLLGGGSTPGEDALNNVTNAGLGMASEAAGEYGAQAGNRTDFGNQLAQGALGKGPSLAQAQLQAAQDRTLAQQIAAAKANRAVNPALASRQAAMAGAQMQQATAQQSAAMRLQEQQQQQQAYQTYLNSLQQSRGVGLSGGAGAAQSLAAANQAAQNRQDNLLGGLLKTGAQVAALGGTSSGASKPSGVIKGDSMADYQNLFSGGMVKPYSDGGVVEDSMAGVAQAYMKGAVVPGKASVSGDSPANDTVEAKLSPGEIVVPRSVVAKGHKEIANFAEALLKLHEGEKSNKSFGAALAHKAFKASKE